MSNEQKCFCGGPVHGPKGWCGGRIRLDTHGRSLFVIRKRINGKQIEISTRKSKLKHALLELDKFERDPAAYLAARELEETTGPLYLTPELAEEYLGYVPISRHDRPLTPHWLFTKEKEMEFWSRVLYMRDLRKVTAKDISPHCPWDHSARHRRSVIRCFFTWLRLPFTDGGPELLAPEEGPNLENLRSIKARVAQDHGNHMPVSQEDWRKVRDYLWNHTAKGGNGSVRHTNRHFALGMDVLAATGWHITELIRFISEGHIEPAPLRQPDMAGVLFCPMAKSGSTLRTAVRADVLKSAEQLIAEDEEGQRRKFGPQKFNYRVVAACKALQLTIFHPGQARHSVATWSLDDGASDTDVAAMLNHRSASTTRKHYASTQVPKSVVPPLPAGGSAIVVGAGSRSRAGERPWIGIVMLRRDLPGAEPDDCSFEESRPSDGPRS